MRENIQVSFPWLNCFGLKKVHYEYNIIFNADCKHLTATFLALIITEVCIQNRRHRRLAFDRAVPVKKTE